MKGSPVENRALSEAIPAARTLHTLGVQQVRGHSGRPLNTSGITPWPRLRRLRLWANEGGGFLCYHPAIPAIRGAVSRRTWGPTVSCGHGRSNIAQRLRDTPTGRRQRGPAPHGWRGSRWRWRDGGGPALPFATRRTVVRPRSRHTNEGARRAAWTTNDPRQSTPTVRAVSRGTGAAAGARVSLSRRSHLRRAASVTQTPDLPACTSPPDPARDG